MDIINNNGMPRKPVRRGDDNRIGYIYLGSVLIIAGALWLFYNFGLIGPRTFDFFFSWQMLLVVLGGYLIAIRKTAGGIIVGGVGLAFLLIPLMGITVSAMKVILPLVVIAIGVAIIASMLGKRR